jgi:uncharacterized RDD family membrane protein YckC
MLDLNRMILHVMLNLMAVKLCLGTRKNLNIILNPRLRYALIAKVSCNTCLWKESDDIKRAVRTMPLLDTHYAMETPEGIELELRVAGVMVRSAAWVIDLVMRLLLYFICIYAFSWLHNVGWGIISILVFMLEWFYPVLFEVYFHGASIGKRAMKIKVVHDNGTPIGWSASLIRNLLRAVDFLPFFYGLGLISMLSNRQFKRLGDLSAGTIVVYHNPENAELAEFPTAEALPINLPLTLQEQKAIINFAQRAPNLAPERAQELAEIVTPLTGMDKPNAVLHLYRLANGLIGRQ